MNVLKGYNIFCTGVGTSGYKTDKSMDVNGQGWQPYISFVSGAMNGMLRTARPSSYDPSNFWNYDYGPMTGSFTVRFNGTNTKLIKGTADWNVIDERIYKKLFFTDIVSEEGERWDLWNEAIPLNDSIDEAEPIE